ncbi:UPF0696 C11orf68-like protein [Micractinium conductrix]|uniref:UPF0696 C11orf68-like protein n=1 Tax=Micractinium conductrix TaxID=554055 RepID=A0A2P6VE24_9CHLO|nr:UPF0696 C11orf68-like protein [Micractinium conductrix]|eukprot:PSC72311.1 UPF0696 C11orf68-like protein [Micractinium conductrix]
MRDYPLAGPPAGTSCSPVAWVAVKAAGAAAPVGPLAGGRGGGGAADRSPQSHGEQQRAVLKDWEAEQQIGSPSAKAAMQASETAVWSAIAHLVQVEGMPGVHLAKIAAGPQQGWSRVICLYTQDFDDQEEIMAAAERLAPVLRAAMPDRKSCKLSYKPDIMTRLDLYKGNAWNINVACYTYKAF